VTNYIGTNNNAEDNRTAVLVIGAVVDGPRSDSVMHLIRNTLSFIFYHMHSSTNEALRYSCAWTLSRICE